MITINSSLTLCTVGTDQMFTNIYAVSCQLSTVHIVTHSAISNQQTYPHVTKFTTTNSNSVQHSSVLKNTESYFNCILFTVRWQPTFPLLLLPHQHTHCCSPQNNTAFVSPSAELKLFVLLLNWTLRYQFDTSKTCCFNSGELSGGLWNSSVETSPKISDTHSAAHKKTFVCSPRHTTCLSKHHQQISSWLISYCWLTCCNFHHHHQCKSLQINQLKHQQLKFQIFNWI